MYVDRSSARAKGTEEASQKWGFCQEEKGLWSRAQFEVGWDEFVVGNTMI